MSDTNRRTLRLTPGLAERIDAQAAREGMSVNGWIVKRLTAAVDNSEPQALDLRDSMEALAAAWEEADRRLDALERLARQAGADF